MSPVKGVHAFFRFCPPKVSLRKSLQKTTALCLLFAGLGLPSEAASLMAPAFADDTPRTAPAPGTEQWMVGVYQEGKRLFDLGDYDGAQREWDKLSGSYDKNPSLKVIVDFMRKRIKEDPDTIRRGRAYQDAQAKAAAKKQEEAAKKSQKAAPPKSEKKKAAKPSKDSWGKRTEETDRDVESFLSQAREDVTRQVRETQRKTPIHPDTIKNNQMMLALFSKGKQTYLKGDLKGAVAAWDKAVSYLPANSPTRRELERLKQNSQRAVLSREAAEAPEPAPEPAMERKPRTPAAEVPEKPAKAPEEMKDFLELANARFRAEAQEARARSSKRAASSSGRQDALNRSFQKTKLLYFQGEYEQAIDELNALAKYFPADSDEAMLITGLRANYLEALKAQDQARQEGPAQPAALQTPSELKSFVAQANRKFDTMIQEARASRSVSQRTAAQREEFVRSAFDRARSYVERNRIEDALSELERIAPYVEDEAEILGRIEELRARQAEVDKLREQAGQPSDSNEKVDRAAIRGISDFIQDAGRRIEAQSKEIKARKKETDAQVRERLRRLGDIFQNARSRYDAGDIEGALELLARMTPDVQNGADFDRAIALLRKDLEESRRAERELQQLESAGGERWAVPTELSALLSETRENIRGHAENMRKKRDTVLQGSQERKRQFDAAYAAGRDAYNAGDLEAALREWQKLVPLVDNGQEFSRYLADVRRDYDAATEAEKASQKIDGQTPLRLPDEFYELLNETAARARERAQKAAADRQAFESTVGQRQEALRRAYEAGRSAYNSGDLEKAIVQWQQLVPLVQDGAQLERALGGLLNDYRAAKKAIDEAESIGKRPADRLSVPADIDKLLDEARKQVDARGRDAKARKQSIEKESSSYRAAFDRALAEGRAAYQAGDLEKAVASWKALVPMTENGASFDKELDELLQRFRQTRTMIADADAAQKAAALPMPAEVSKMLADAQKQVQARFSDAAVQKKSSEKKAAESKAAYEAALAKGRAAYEAGDLQKAVQSWRSLVPVLQDSREFSQQLDALETKLTESRTLIADADAAQKAAVLPMPAEVSKMLADAQKQVEARHREASTRRSSLEKEAAEKKAVYDAATAEATAAYRAGDLEKAITAWKKLAPVLVDGRQFAEKLDALHERYRDTQKQIAAAEIAEQNAKLYVPGDVTAWMAEAEKQSYTRLQETLARKEALEKTVRERKAAYESAVAEGRAAQKAGDTEAALRAWKKLTPHVEGGAALDKQITTTLNQLSSARDARASADALALENKPFAVPSELPAALSEISKKLEADLAQSRVLAAAAQAKAAERRKRVDTAIAEGLGLYKNGLTAEAIQRWESILPDLSDSDRLQKAILDLQRGEQELAVLQKSALQSEVDSKKQLPVPIDLTKALESAFASAQAKIEEAKNRQASANDESVRRQTLVTESIQNGKLALARGDVETAVAEWTKIAAYLENGQSLVPKLQELKTTHQVLAETQKAASMAEERNMGKLKSLPEVDAFVTEATLKYKADTDSSNVRKEQAEASLAQKRAQVEHTALKAREIFEKGDIPGASMEIMKLQTLVEDPIALQSQVGSIQAAYEQSLKAQVDAADAVKRANETLFKSPPELSLLLKDADLKVRELAQLANSQKLEAEQALKEKEAFVQQAFEKGKALYWQGKLDEALAEWDNMAPLLEDGGKIREVSGRYQETLHMQRQAREIDSRRNEKFRTPEELQRLLGDAEKILSSQSAFAQARQRTAQDEISGRQEFINRTFQKGKALYEQGLMADAIEEWEKLAPVLENGSKVKEFIDGVKSNFKGVQAARKGAEEAQARSIVAPQAPADLTRLLAEANQGLQTETQRLREERQQAEDALREKQKMIDGIFLKGKTLYQAGRLEEAVDTWKTLLPFVDDNTSIRQLIQQAEDSRRRLLAERYEVQTAVQQPQAPGAMQFALEETNASLKEQIARQQAARLEADLRAVVGAPPGAKPAVSSAASPAEGPAAEGHAVPFKLDEIEQMMLEYQVITPEDLKKRRDELQSKAAAQP